MTAAPASPTPAFPAPRRAGESNAPTPSPERLWPSLSKQPPKPRPPEGADLFGEWVRGSIARWRAAHTGDRDRAARICRRSDELEAFSIAAFADAVERAREHAILHRRDPAALDEAFALGRETVRRTLGFKLHPEQVMGALAMARGCVAEMATGEGKTVTAILPAAWLAWRGRGVHVMTVNDYLADRDAITTEPAYRLLGVTVGALRDKQERDQRARMYARGVTYGAEKQFIFDLLRDRTHTPLRATTGTLVLDQLTGEASIDGGVAGWSKLVVQRGHFAAIVDEADSILIDEAVTPAILGEDAESPAAEHYNLAAEIAGTLERNRDYDVDTRRRRCHLTDAGRERLTRLAERLPPFWSGPRRREELAVRAVEAVELYTRDDDYVVREGKIVIVDRSTGRLLEGRQWQLGVHQAVEAKERLEITADRRTVARLSYQRFFQRYPFLAGMTGTAKEVAHELWREYRTPVVRVPTHKPISRTHGPDRVFTSERAKLEAVADRAAEIHAARRPVLIGTRSVETSEALASLLQDRGTPCRVLNAHRETEEAEIIEKAGEAGAVTVATNMAGRGTDIKLTDETRALGGLFVIATERHDEARVDRQLFGRAGRQGDPGHAEAYVAATDCVIERFAIPPLTAIVRTLPPALRHLPARALWWQAQKTAAARHAVARRQTTRYDAWGELAMHHETR
ncbi:MAG: hypothetical protein EA378_07730 [Phycisphaerales bacterium]|nr:MAG: hypothetical protein EA378_07730 [Phycisphaerales bacterium]